MVGVAEHIGGRLVDRRLARAGRRVGPGTGMDLQRVETVAGGHRTLPVLGGAFDTAIAPAAQQRA